VKLNRIKSKINEAPPEISTDLKNGTSFLVSNVEAEMD